MLFSDPSPQSCVPSERTVFEPTEIKFGGGKKCPGLARMFPIQNFESQTNVFGCALQRSGTMIHALGIDPAGFPRTLLANEERGNQSAIPSQGTRNGSQPVLDQVEPAMTENRLGQCEIESHFRLNNDAW